MKNSPFNVVRHWKKIIVRASRIRNVGIVVAWSLLLAIPTLVVAQTVPGFTVTTFATGISGARLVNIDLLGNVYTMGRDTGIVYKISPGGVVSVLANLGSGFYVGPHFDPVSGDVFAAECRANARIFRINSLGVVSTFVSGAAGLFCPAGFDNDASGNIYASLATNPGSVVKITPAGMLSTYATGLNSPDGIDFGPAGELYVGDRGTGTIKRVPAGGGVATVFASGFSLPIDVESGSAGNLYVANFSNNTISKVTPAGAVSTFGTGFGNPVGVAFDSSGSLFIASFGTGRIYKVVSVGNQPPVCNAGGPYSAGCAGATTGVSLNGGGSSDPDGDVLSYAWTSSCPGGTFNNSASKTPTLTVGTSPGCNVSCSASLTVSDGKGGTSTCGAAVTITDSSGPVFSGVPATATAECNALPPTPGVTANDACSGSTTVTSSESIATGSCPGTFVLTRTWSATDGCGNSTSTSQDVSVMDTIDPILVGVPADVSAECDNVPPAATVTSSDTCDTNVPVTFAETHTNGSCSDEYTLTRSWTAVDDCGKDVTALQYVSVDDTVKPALVCPAGATLECPANTSVAANGSASATDNCATPLVSSSDAVAAGCGTTQTITRTWSASDDCGNSSSCDQTISVVDTQAPVVSVDTTPIHVVDTDCSGGETVALPSGTANDACDGAVPVTNNAPATFLAGVPTTVTYSASDACGNGSTDSLDVTVDYGANIAIQANKHTVGGGTYPGSTKTPLDGIIVCAYSKADGSCSRTVCGGISHQHYACIVASCQATNCCTTDSTGACMINLPPGDYIVASDDATKTTLPDPLGVSASDLECGETKQKHLQQIVKANGQKVPAKTTVRTGSELLIIEPEFVVWDATEQLYPFVFDSLGDWGVTATVAPPDGFVADHDALAAQVASTIAAVQFTITEVGSDLVPTETTFEVTHKGRREVIRSQVGIFLTSEYARARGFNVAQLRASGLIKERPDNQGQGNEHGRR